MEASRVVRVLVSTQSLLQQLVSLCTDAWPERGGRRRNNKCFEVVFDIKDLMSWS